MDMLIEFLNSNGYQFFAGIVVVLLVGWLAYRNIKLHKEIASLRYTLEYEEKDHALTLQGYHWARDLTIEIRAATSLEEVKQYSFRVEKELEIIRGDAGMLHMEYYPKE